MRIGRWFKITMMVAFAWLLILMAIERKVHAQTAAVSSSVVSPADAGGEVGENETVAGGESGASLEEMVEIVTRVRASVELVPGQPAAVDMSLIEVPGAEPELLEGVVAKGYVRYVEHEGRRIGQALLTGVEKDERMVPLRHEDFTTQFALSEADEGEEEGVEGEGSVAVPAADEGELAGLVFEGSEEVLIEGDGPQLVRALRELQAAQKQQDGKEEEDGSQQQIAGRSRGGGEAGGESGSNDLASGYQSPEGVRPLRAEESGTPSVNVTEDGCDVRVVMEQEVVIQQSRAEISQGGTVQDKGECSDSASRFPLQKSYSACDDLVNIEGREAASRFRYFYLDGNLARTDVGECRKDDEKVFEIVEDHVSCPIYLDWSRNMAVPQARLVYLDDNNRRTEARACQDSDSKSAVPLVETDSGCGLRHDFEAGKSIRQTTFLYTLESQTFQAQPCLDTDDEYAHRTVYRNSAGGNICEPVVITDEAGGSFTRQSRVEVTVDGRPQYVTECTPDTQSSPLTATTEGCMNMAEWNHDREAGQSYGQERFYYEANVDRVYVTECRDSTVTYRHQSETALYEHHDEGLYSLPATTVYITTPAGRHDIVHRQVLPGTAQLAYDMSGTADQPNGSKEYSGCDLYRLTDKVENYTRPDGTTYARRIGPGSPQGPVNDCTVTSSDRRRTGEFRDSGCYREYQYQGVETRRRGDGITFTQTGSATWSGRHYACRKGATTWGKKHSCQRKDISTRYWSDPNGYDYRYRGIKYEETCKQNGSQRISHINGKIMPSKKVQRTVKRTGEQVIRSGQRWLEGAGGR